MKVLKPFTCRVTKIRYEEGQEYTGQRVDELAAKGFVEAGPLKEKAEQAHIAKNPEVFPPKKRKK